MWDRDHLEKISQKKEDWKSSTAKKAKDSKEVFRTLSDIPIELLYTPEHLPEFDYLECLGFPGEFPYTRGIYPTMYRGRLWTMRQFAGFGSARDTNKRFKFLLSHGQTGLSTAFDMPTLMGRDSDDPHSEGEVGKEGVAVDSLEDMEILFDSINPEDITTSMTISSPAAILWAMYLAVAEKKGVDLRKISGTTQTDILKEYMAQKEYIFPPRPSMKIITDMFAFGAKHVPKWNVISISGYHIREAGSTAVQELAFTLANGVEYVRAGVDAGLQVDEFVPRFSFFFNSHIDFFEEIAKYRAARRIWARTLKEKFGAKDPRSLTLRFHTQTAGCSLTRQQPKNNMVRTALEALAAVYGGTQSLHTNSYDEAHALPAEHAVQIALRTQQIIAHESGASDTIDPLAGSYFVEWLTNKMEEEANKYFEKIENIGGVIAGIEQGFFQSEIARAAFQDQKKVESGERVVVGVNAFMEEEKKSLKVLKIKAKVEDEQIKRLKKLRQKRNNSETLKALRSLKSAAKNHENLMPKIMNAVKAYATLGEMAGELKEVFGEYREKSYF